MKRRLGLAAIAGFCIACSSEPSGPSPKTIMVTPDSIALEQGDSAQLDPSVLDDNGHLVVGVSVVFTSQDPTIASVTPVGKVKSVGPAGITAIKITAAGLSRKVPVVVGAVADAITLTPTAPVIAQLTSVQLTGHVLDRNGDGIAGAPISYVSANPSLASVDGTGKVTSVGPAGSVLIGAQSGSLNTSVAVVIAQVPTSVSLLPNPLTVAVGGTGHLLAQIRDAVGTVIPGGTFGFTSGNTGLITVDNTGLVTSVAQTGSTTIHVVSGTLSADATVNVIVTTHPIGNVMADVPVGGGAYGAAISPTGVVYVATLGGEVWRGSLSSFSFTSVIGSLGALAAVVFNPAGDNAYVAYPPDGVQFIDVATNSITTSAGPIVTTPFDVIASANGQRVYVGTDGFVYTVDVATHSLVDSIQIGAIIHIALDPTQTRLYASAYNEGKVYELDAGTLDILRTFSPGGTVQDLEVTPDGGTLYVADEQGQVHVIDLTTGNSTSFTGVCPAYGLLVTKDALQVYISCSQSGQIQIIDTGTGAVVKTLPGLGTVRRITLSPDGLSVVGVTEGGRAILIQ